MLQLQYTVLKLQFESVWPIRPLQDKKRREDFGQEREKKRPLVASPKKRFHPLKDFAEAINEVSSQSIAVPKPKVDFVRELISTKIVQPKKLLIISDVIDMSKNISDFKGNLRWGKVKMDIGLNTANA